ncbi:MULTISPECIES: superoxide dismutase [Acinetobacter calcoaceticus/baumannii complex]|uniref:superoxide dismutase n=1 Tax=Acinetobacter calcoaceticus/baumannii complex TaxID=909768 RepID=UPI00344BC07C
MTHFSLPDLPYSHDALEPHISKETLEFHHDKHHQTYVTNLNNLVKDTDLTDQSLEDIIVTTANDSTKAGIFNNAAQVWNHTFYWHCMKPQGGGKPEDTLAAKIEADFGSYENFLKEFTNAAITQFGSGWAWLVTDQINGKLSIAKTSNADTPLAHGQIALLTIDVWEHAYYIDFRNARPKYIETFLENLINWEFVNARYTGQITSI